ncbi:GNAT family N-acetyltransferase [Motiliproteus sediminis]|uniref:GNAT family N-acetyltransferase n=1 Tax=Motiliproteus sediminis TaxID=1468178 RepID=UPI001AEFFEA9|nr:GNAT family N-acetyltransferase [Motiliproteus sediminis]
MSVTIVNADYERPDHADAIVALLDAYALDPMGGGKALSQRVRDRVVAALAQQPGAFSLLAYVDQQPAGLANCFQGFSTFACQPLINLHDLAVLPAYRRRGLAQALLQQVEEIARQRGCCKVTLEVLSGNQAARQAYAEAGFAAYELDPLMGQALFLEKPL